MLNALLQAAIS